MKITFFFTAFTLLFLFQGYSQERYVVEYNAKTGEAVYKKYTKKTAQKDSKEKNGNDPTSTQESEWYYKVIKEPKRFNKRDKIRFKIINVNPFAVQVNAEMEQQKIHKSGDSYTWASALANVSNLGGKLGNTKLNIDSLDKGMNKLFIDRSAGSFIREIENKRITLNSIEQTLIIKLQNPYSTKEELLEFFKELYSVDPNPGNNSEELFVNISSEIITNKDFIKLRNKFNSSFDNIKGEMFNSIRKQESKLEKEESNFQKNPNKSRSAEEIEKNANDLENLKNLNKNSQSELTILEDEIQNEILELQNMYNQIQNSTFEVVVPDYALNSDFTTIKFDFNESRSLRSTTTSNNNDQENEVLPTQSFEFFARGGWKINTSVALTLNNFSDNSNSFFIDSEGEIGADQNSFFVPNLSTMLNAYPLWFKNFNVGMSMGISVPITSELSGINFLFGPSVILGGDSRVALSGGFAYGPVERLTNGLEIGDTTTVSDLSPFIEDVYDLGWFVGISFTLFDVNN